MIGNLSFLVALVLVSLIVSITLGIGVQITASQFKLGPLPRAFIGLSIIFILVISKSIDLGIIRAAPFLLLIYYIGTFQIGTKLAHAAGIEAPEDNDPPDAFFEMINRYN